MNALQSEIYSHLRAGEPEKAQHSASDFAYNLEGANLQYWAQFGEQNQVDAIIRVATKREIKRRLEVS